MEHSAIGFHLPSFHSDEEIRSQRANAVEELQHTVETLLPVIKSTVLELLVFALVFVIGWLLIENFVLPPYPTFTLIILFLLATALGRLLDYLKVVGLLGMLVAGLIVRNGFSLSFDPEWSSNLRHIALAIILLSGGLGLKWDQLKAAGATTFLLAFLPAPVEALSVAIAAHYILNLPFLWSFLLGCGIAAVSPAVVVPIMIRFIQKDLGTNKRIPTIVIAASGVDDILGVTAFTILLGYLGTPPALAWIILKPPLEIFGGIAVGTLVGSVYTHVYAFTDIYKHPFVHFFVTVSTAAAMMLGGSHFDGTAAGALSVLVFGMALSFLEPDKQKTLRMYVQTLWTKLAMPLLFSLIGEAIVFSRLDWRAVGFGVVIIMIGLVFRAAAAYTAVLSSPLTHTERLFIALSWMPKATVQAVMASLPLDAVVNSGNDQDIQYAKQLLSILALSIFLTAPTAAFFIERLGPVMLQQTNDSTGAVVVVSHESKKEDMKEDKDCV